MKRLEPGRPVEVRPRGNNGLNRLDAALALRDEAVKRYSHERRRRNETPIEREARLADRRQRRRRRPRRRKHEQAAPRRFSRRILTMPKLRSSSEPLPRPHGPLPF